MSNKPNLADLFQVRDLIQPRSVLTEGESDIDDKTPYQISQDIKDIVDIMNQNAHDGDIMGICKCIDAISLRVMYLQETVIQIQQILDKRNQNKND